MDLIRQGLAIAQNPKHNTWINPLLLLSDAALGLLIIQKIPYTEIDWVAYMDQIRLYLSGERTYTLLTGSTGPLVYPGLHVYLYRLLYTLTSSGTDIRLAQYLFLALYLLTLAVVLSAYRAAGAPPWVLPLLVLSKRLHSVFVLRLFNDCFAAAGLWAAVACWQRRWWGVGAVVFSLGVGVKMSVLLAAPAVGVVLWLGAGREAAVRAGVVMGAVQVLLGYEFLAVNPRAYLSRAFELSRVFMFKWTVNWRFVGEEVFLSRGFSLALLGLHAALLLAFLHYRWLKPAGISLSGVKRMLLQPPSKLEQERISRRVTPEYVMTTVLTATMIGCLCARSLHYQFYAYIAWSTPFLLWRAGLHPVAVYVIWAAQEVAWNVYPSTDLSSMAVVGCLAVTVAAGWRASTNVTATAVKKEKASRKREHVE